MSILASGVQAALQATTHATISATGQSAVHASTEITIGEHAKTVQVFGLTIDLDVVWATLLAGAIVLTLGFMMRARVTSGVPGKLQLFWETVVEQVRELTDSAIGPQGRKFVPLAVALFLFILMCNWLEVIPSGHNPEWLTPPTADVNLPLAMALRSSHWCSPVGPHPRLEGIRQALLPAVRGHVPDQRDRGDHQTDHADVPTPATCSRAC